MSKTTTIDVTTRYQNLNTIVAANNILTTVAFPLGPCVLEQIWCFYPRGNNGQCGFNLQYQGFVILPWNGAGTTMNGDGERLVFDLGIHLEVNPLLNLVNVDVIPHGLLLTAKYRDVVLPSDSEVAPIPAIRL